jgi:hypothetical protein
VLALIEPEVRYISGVDRMTSTAAEGSATVRLEFTDGTDMTQAMTDVETAVKAVNNLPEDAEDPTITRSVFFDTVARLAVFGSADEVVKRAWAKRIRDDLIDRGIDKINFTGLRDAEIRIEVPEIELRRLGHEDIRRVQRSPPTAAICRRARSRVRSTASFAPWPMRRAQGNWPCRSQILYRRRERSCWGTSPRSPTALIADDPRAGQRIARHRTRCPARADGRYAQDGCDPVGLYRRDQTAGCRPASR